MCVCVCVCVCVCSVGSLVVEVTRALVQYILCMDHTSLDTSIRGISSIYTCTRISSLSVKWDQLQCML